MSVLNKNNLCRHVWNCLLLNNISCVANFVFISALNIHTLTSNFIIRYSYQMEDEIFCITSTFYSTFYRHINLTNYSTASSKIHHYRTLKKVQVGHFQYKTLICPPCCFYNIQEINIQVAELLSNNVASSHREF